MSKLNQHFDNIQVSEDLETKTLNRIRLEKIRQDIEDTQKINVQKAHTPWYKRVSVYARAAAAFAIIAVLLVSILLNLPTSYEPMPFRPEVTPPFAGASHAFRIQDQHQLNNLFNLHENNPHLLVTSPDEDEPHHFAVSSIATENMQEGDIIKYEGNYIYRLSPIGLTIVEVNNGQVNHINTIQYQNFAPVEMLVQNNRLIILGGLRNNLTAPPTSIAANRQHNRMQVRVYDITNRAHPILERFFEVDGRFNTARIYSNTLFFIVDFFPVTLNRCQNTGTLYRQVNLPYFRKCQTDEPSQIALSNLFYTVQNVRMQSFMLLGSIEIFDKNEDITLIGYLSASNIISISGLNLYTATTVWTLEENNHWVDRSHISRFCLNTLEFSGTATVLGAPLSEYAINEYDGYLRVITQYGDWWRSWNNPDFYFATGVFVFDEDLKLVSYLIDIAEGETMYTARFDRSRAYIFDSSPLVVSTPLYTINLTDHHNISSIREQAHDAIRHQYIRRVGDSGLNIGIRQSRQTGVVIELFEVGVGIGILSSHTILGEWTQTNVLYESGTLLLSYCEMTSAWYVGLSAIVAGRRERWNTVTIMQGFYLFRLESGARELEFLGESRQDDIFIHTAGGSYAIATVSLLIPSFSNFDTNNDISPFEYGISWESWLAVFSRYINRAVIIDGYLYTIADSVIAGYNIYTRDRLGVFEG